MRTTVETKGKAVSTDHKEPHTGTIFTVPLERLDRNGLDWAGGKEANLGVAVRSSATAEDLPDAVRP